MQTETYPLIPLNSLCNLAQLLVIQPVDLAEPPDAVTRLQARSICRTPRYNTIDFRKRRVDQALIRTSIPTSPDPLAGA